MQLRYNTAILTIRTVQRGISYLSPLTPCYITLIMIYSTSKPLEPNWRCDSTAASGGASVTGLLVEQLCSCAVMLYWCHHCSATRDSGAHFKTETPPHWQDSTHTTSFNTKGWKGRDSASGIGRKSSKISPAASSEQLPSSLLNL